MTPGTQPDWGRIGRLSLLSSVLVAVVLFFVLPDDRWIAGVVLGVGMLEGVFMWRVMPALSGGSAAAQVDRMNAEAEAQAEILDGDWGEPPPSGPATPADE